MSLYESNLGFLIDGSHLNIVLVRLIALLDAYSGTSPTLAHLREVLDKARRVLFELNSISDLESLEQEEPASNSNKIPEL